MNLSQWSLQQEINLKMPASCLSWNPSLSRLHPWMLAVGSDDANPSSGGKVFLFEYSENSHRWSKAETISSITDPVHDIAFAPNLGRSYHILGVASKDVRIIVLRPPQYAFEIPNIGLLFLQLFLLQERCFRTLQYFTVGDTSSRSV
jgi:nucleoporin SEH1